MKVLFLILALVSAQRVTLDQLTSSAQANYPLVKQYELINASEQFTLQNASTAYLPQFSISGSASYQSHAIKMPFSIPGIDIPSLSKDQYRAVAEVSQTIWDGGVISAQKKNIRAQSEVSRKENEVEMYALNERVNNLFFGILLLNEQLNQLKIFEEELETNFKKIESYIANGVAHRSDLDVVKVEQLSVKQRRVEMETMRDAYLKMLSLLSGVELDSKTELVKPMQEVLKDPSVALTLLSSPNRRPELSLFDAKNNELEVQRNYINAKNLPKIGLFVQGGYGRPGLNMLKDDFSTFAIGGVRLLWNFGGLYTVKNERRLIDRAEERVETMRETFLFNMGIVSEQQAAEIKKQFSIMKYDEEVIALRRKIREAAEEELKNGTINAADLMQEVNKEQMSKQEKILHEIQLLKSIIELKNIKNQ